MHMGVNFSSALPVIKLSRGGGGGGAGLFSKKKNSCLWF